MADYRRVGGPRHVVRPFEPMQGITDPRFAIADAIDHIARAVSAIDHNLELLIGRMEANSAAIVRVAAVLEKKTR